MRTVVLTMILRLRSPAVKASEAEPEMSASLYGFIEDRPAGIDDVRASGAGGFMMTRRRDA